LQITAGRAASRFVGKKYHQKNCANVRGILHQKRTLSESEGLNGINLIERDHNCQPFSRRQGRIFCAPALHFALNAAAIIVIFASKRMGIGPYCNLKPEQT